MRRHDSLIPLTHDHHHVLKQATALRTAARTNDDEQMLATAREFVAFFETEGIAHFREEEEELFPLVIDRAEARAVLEQAMMEHLLIHAAVRAMKHAIDDGSLMPGTLERVALLLEPHVRLEEKVLFPMIERLVADEELRSLKLDAARI